MCINVEGGGVEAPWGLLIITLTKQNVILLRQMRPNVQTSAADALQTISNNKQHTRRVIFKGKLMTVANVYMYNNVEDKVGR